MTTPSKSCSTSASLLLPFDGHDICFCCFGWWHQAEAEFCPACQQFAESVRSLKASPALAKVAVAAPLCSKPWDEYDEEDDWWVYEVKDPATLFDEEPTKHCYLLDDLPGLFPSSTKYMVTPLPPPPPLKNLVVIALEEELCQTSC